MDKSRRGFLGLGGGVVLLGILGSGSARAADAVCYDLSSLPLSQKSAHRSLNFQDASSDPKKHCNLCAYFATTTANCGSCALLNGGAVSGLSVCDNFAPKAA